ncbi:ABC transporter permease [Nocardia alba]|uniref:Sulfonate transport system permease protein n=1 Tax=Nocardia alba TaxID=225051 RepID=A0A4R1G734_9NOCA|nr:ABC transporter permease [Nocardia alba]TCJ99691.1 sulfonate transport system permease protein [Nocardia alba]
MTIALPRTTIPVTKTIDDGFVERRTLRRLGLRKAVPAARLLGVLLVVAAWAAGSLLELIDPRKLSAPWTVLQTGWELLVDGPLLANLGVSLQRVLIGMVVGVLIGTTLAVIAGLSRWGESLIDGPVQIKRAIPTLGLIPLMILWLGIGEEFKLVLITLGVVVHMYIQTHASLTTIDQKLVELSEVQGVSRAEFIRSVVLPGSLPGFFLGLRMSVTSAWLVLIVVETVNAIDGLGKMMSNAQNYGQADVILVGLVVYAIFGLASDSAIRLVERRVLSWRRTIAG